ncbi:MAG: glycine--tRNA ligase subunit beta [Candidatus Paracaedibacteraceae bacterium]|nr:glycine--tRNA ligase subunit beta [Candidatus Paracaedibacteraceae bacterium]
MSQEFLFEILSEEIPARMQVQAMDDFKAAFITKLKAAGLSFSHIETHITPRRLVACISGLAFSTPETHEDRRGPRLEAPDAALQGFLKATGLTKEQLTQKDGYWYAMIATPATPAAAILPNLCRDIMREFRWPKSMRWYGAPQTWVRPVRGILALLDGKTLTFDIPEFNLTSSNKTNGHRFLSVGEFEVNSFADYKQQLANRYVILSHQQRQDSILTQLIQLGKDQGYTLELDDKLLEEVAGLSEYPQPVLGEIDKAFLHLPKRVLSTSMRVHQKYFTYVDAERKVASIFGLVANTIPSDDGATMRRGYERVLRARLSDASFFYEQDLKIPLKDHLPRLHQIVFHAKLGSLGDRVQRLMKLVESATAQQAAELCKSDLVTSMVGEFPELQGYMGGIYALAQGHSAEISQAIEQHYQPVGPTDACPTDPIAIDLALAEKLDTLVGFFAIGELPTGSKDPYALRRAALGVIRIIRENSLENINLLSKINRALTLYLEQGIHAVPGFEALQVLDFIMERLGHALKTEGLRHDTIAAVLESFNRGDNICGVVDRIKALNAYLTTEAGLSLQATFRRAYGILPKDRSITYAVQPHLFIEKVETALYTELETVTTRCESLLKIHDYGQLMMVLANLKNPIDAFFDLKINDDNLDIRHNRLALLQMLINQTTVIADFSKLEG